MLSRRLLAAAPGLALLLVVLAGCGLLGPRPKLSVSPTTIAMTANGAAFDVSNTGPKDTVLAFTVSSGDANVAVNPTSGSLASGASTTITIGVSSSSLAPGTNLATTITVGGNGGTDTVAVDYGIGTCGTYTPQAVTTLGAAALANGAQRTAPSSAPALNPQDTIPNQIIVGYTTPTNPTTTALRTQALQQASADVRRAYGLTLLAGGTGHGPDLISTTDVTTTLAKLHADPRVRYAQPNRHLHLLTVPNDPYYPPNATFPDGQWNLTDFGLEQAWTIETGTSSRPIVIGIIDSGVDSSHDDLVNKLVPGYDFNGNDTNTNPGTAPYNADQDHGTHVAGIAAAQGNNNTGIAGVAYDPNVKILPLKIFDDTGSGATIYDLIRAIDWAAGLGDPAGTATPNINPNKADILNMSIGVEGDQPAVDAAALDAWNNGVLLVAAAGNHGSGTSYPTDPGILSPANAPCVIAVGSVDSPTTLSYFSNTGPQLEVTAPGGFYNATNSTTDAIVSTLPGNTYGLEAGTSMASPFVAGAAALLEAQNPTRTPTQLRNLLDGTTLRTPTMTDRSQYGYGVICTDAALGATTTCGQ